MNTFSWLSIRKEMKSKANPTLSNGNKILKWKLPLSEKKHRSKDLMCLHCKDQIVSVPEYMKAHKEEVQVKSGRPLSNGGETPPDQKGPEIVLILQREGKR